MFHHPRMIPSTSGSSAPIAVAASAVADIGITTSPSKTSSSPRVIEFEKKLIETDSYLQILIDQVKGLDERIEQQTTSENEKRELAQIRANTLILLESVKHTIVLLQIAKNTIAPVNGLNPKSPHDASVGSSHSQRKSGSSDHLLPHHRRHSHHLHKHRKQQQHHHHQHPEAASGTVPTGHEVTVSDSGGIAVVATAGTGTGGSCSGSDDDEDDDSYYDAREDDAGPFSSSASSSSPVNHAHPNNNSNNNNNSSSNPNSPGSGMGSSGKGVASVPSPASAAASGRSSHAANTGTEEEEEDELSSCSTSRKSRRATAFDYDAMYEDDEEELESLETHGSVISHLISQVKIGMDLTKVVLPTFILERRSLLEMYADFFAHPDLFVSITDQPTQESRFIQVVKWYLSAFHAGRKSSVAKKPYNPILGEVFKCRWQIPNHASDSSNSRNAGKVTSDGPVPGSDVSELTFIAEQVSHHPPISAFYAEHPGKRVSCTAQIYTKSQFLGISVGVHNLGKGSIHLMDHEEEYVVNFPSAYGRSILTIPWIELGGPVSITCPQSGYSANIEFLTKPFFGGKKHKITCEVLSPGKKVILNVSGEWNGILYAKHPNQGKQEVFVDTKQIPIIKKKVAQIDDQEEHESRFLWKDLTLALKIHDVNLANVTKSNIEQQQRDLVEERREARTEWQHRHFHQNAGTWLYKKPLTERISSKKV